MAKASDDCRRIVTWKLGGRSRDDAIEPGAESLDAKFPRRDEMLPARNILLHMIEGIARHVGLTPGGTGTGQPRFRMMGSVAPSPLISEQAGMPPPGMSGAVSKPKPFHTQAEPALGSGSSRLLWTRARAASQTSS